MSFSSIYHRIPSGSLLRRLAQDEGGASAIEFALVAIPLLMFIFGIIGYGLFFLNQTWLKYSVDSAARIVRTGELNTAGAKGAPITVGEFQSRVCSYAKPVLDCGKISVLVTHASNWSGITPPSCTGSGGDMSGSTGASGDALTKYTGGASEVVLVTACYRWDLAAKLPYLTLPSILAASTAFKTEPYSN
jgi:Flp pilus assembly protein TadG